MNIQGFNKLTLLDFPGHTAATVFFGGCNLRCPFCQNASLVLDGGRPQKPLDPDEIISYLEKRQGILDGVCITGGEPLLDPHVGDLCRRIKTLGYAVKLDTNGSFPDRMAALYEKRLIDYVALDVKNDPLHYPETVGVPGFDVTPVRETITWLHSHSLPYECRTTVVKNFHNENRLLALARWIYPTQKYFLQAFEDNGTVICNGLEGYSAEELKSLLDTIQSILPETKIRGV